MKPKLLLVAVVVLAALGLGSVIAWGAAARSQPAPAVWTHGAAKSPVEHGFDMGAMHRGLDQADLDRMVKACDKVMKNGGMSQDADGHMDEPMDRGMMDDDADMMEGGMMGGGMG